MDSRTPIVRGTPTRTARPAATCQPAPPTIDVVSKLRLRNVVPNFQSAGLTLGLAIMGAILASFGPGAVFARTISDEHHEAFARGFSTALTVNAAVTLLAAIIAVAMLRPTRRHSYGGR